MHREQISHHKKKTFFKLFMVIDVRQTSVIILQYIKILHHYTALLKLMSVSLPLTAHTQATATKRKGVIRCMCLKDKQTS